MVPILVRATMREVVVLVTVYIMLPSMLLVVLLGIIDDIRNDGDVVRLSIMWQSG